MTPLEQGQQQQRNLGISSFLHRLLRKQNKQLRRTPLHQTDAVVSDGTSVAQPQMTVPEDRILPTDAMSHAAAEATTLPDSSHQESSSIVHTTSLTTLRSRAMKSFTTGVKDLGERTLDFMAENPWLGLKIAAGYFAMQHLFNLIDSIIEDDESPSLFCKPKDLQRVLKMEPPQNPQLMDLIVKLLRSRLPLRQTDNPNATNSVESVLKSLTKTEANLLQQVWWSDHDFPHKEDIVWDDIAGHYDIKESLLDVLVTLQPLPNSSLPELLQPPKGILLYGPPGCGKSMLIHALAKSAHARVLVVNPSTLLNKYVGESNKMCKTLFDLAHKLSPCLIVLEELDGIFFARSSGEAEHNILRDLKTEFFQRWDGAMNSYSGQVVIVGTTNRPFDVDAAILRRMPLSFFVGLPNFHARAKLVEGLLDSVPHNVNAQYVAQKTEFYSGSDLNQLLKTAMTLGPLREFRTALANRKNLRPLVIHDIHQALRQVRPTPLTYAYRQRLAEFSGNRPEQPQQQRQQQEPTFYNMGTMYLDTNSQPPSFVWPPSSGSMDEFWNMPREDEDDEQYYSPDSDDDEESSDDLDEF